MSPLIAYHSSSCCHRFGIRKYGLLPDQPNAGQPFGVYVFRDDYRHVTTMRDRRRDRRYWVVWSHRPPADLWEVAYIGPLRPDPYVTNGLVLLEQPQHVSLVSPVSLVTS